MSLTTHQPMRQCGRPFASEAEALRSKRGQSGNYLPVPCLTGCPPGTVHLRRKPVPQARTAAPPADTGPDAATRALVLARDGYACVCCGRSVIGRRYSLQHRKRRSQGGSSRPSNLLTVLGDGTRGCHARIDSRIDPHDEASGYTVRSHDDPALTGVLYVSEHGSGVLMYLDDEGGISPDCPAGAA